MARKYIGGPPWGAKATRRTAPAPRQLVAPHRLRRRDRPRDRDAAGGPAHVRVSLAVTGIWPSRPNAGRFAAPNAVDMRVSRARKSHWPSATLKGDGDGRRRFDDRDPEGHSGWGSWRSHGGTRPPGRQ